MISIDGYPSAHTSFASLSLNEPDIVGFRVGSIYSSTACLRNGEISDLIDKSGENGFGIVAGIVGQANNEA